MSSDEDFSTFRVAFFSPLFNVDHFPAQILRWTVQKVTEKNVNMGEKTTRSERGHCNFPLFKR